MLDFLERYQHGGRRQKPTLQEASKLQDIIVSHAGALTVPDLEADLSTVNEPLRKYLLSHSAPRAMRACRSSSNNGLASLGPSFSGSYAATDQSISEDGVPPSQGEVLGAELLAITVPDAVRSEIPYNFFLDNISPSSPVLASNTPLLVVVKQSCAALKLLSSKHALARMLRFASRVEEGYPADGCE